MSKLNLNWKKYKVIIAVLLIAISIVIIPFLINKFSWQKGRIPGLEYAEKIAISNAEGFTNGTVILTTTLIHGIEPAQIISSVLKDSHGETIQVIDSICEEIPLSEETQFSVTFNLENIELMNDYVVILCSKKDSSFVSPSFKFSSPG